MGAESDSGLRRMVTFFTTTKPFTGTARIRQMNALVSWRCVHPDAEVIVFGAGEGVDAACSQLSIRYEPAVEVNEFGTPLISSVFARAQALARHELLAFVNADIVLIDDFAPAISRIRCDRFLLAGQRWDVDMAEPLDFNGDWRGAIRRAVSERGRRHPPAGSDYFVFPRGLWTSIPSFAVGRVGWDNWILYRCLADRVAVIDGSSSITAIHQNHEPYAHSWRTGSAGRWRGPETDRNTALAGAGGHVTLRHATHRLTTRGARRRKSPSYFLDRLTVLPILDPRFEWLKPIGWVARTVRWAIEERVPVTVLVHKAFKQCRRLWTISPDTTRQYGR